MDMCDICGRYVPEGRQICWCCERRHVTPSDCLYFSEENYICTLTGMDCAGYQCEQYEKGDSE